MKAFKYFLLVGFLLGSFHAGYGQILILDAGFVGEPQVVTIQDLNLISPSGTQLFYVNMSCTSVEPVPVRLFIEIEGRLNDGTNEMIAQGKTQVFELSAGNPINITNVNLKSELKIDTFELVGDKIFNKILATGSLPDGTFLFKLTLRPEFGESQIEPVTETIEMNIDNPTTLELIFPGMSESIGEQNFPVVSSTNPIFIWQGESRNPYTVTLAKRDTDDQDGETALNTAQKRWMVRIDGTSVTYSQAETPIEGTSYFPLEDGVYFWQVETYFSTAGGGQESIKSEIFAFRYSSLTGQTESSSLPPELLMALRSLLEKLNVSQEIINNFENGTYIPLGFPVYNGQRMTPAGVRTIIMMIDSGELEVVNIENN